MVNNLTEQINSLKKIFSISVHSQTKDDTTMLLIDYAKEDQSIDDIELGLSYINRGLYIEGATLLNSALKLNTANIDLDYIYEILPTDSSILVYLESAFENLVEVDSTNLESYFYLTLLNSNKQKSIEYR